MQALARRRLRRRVDPSPEEWAEMVEKALRRGYRLVRVPPDLIVEIRDYALAGEDVP